MLADGYSLEISDREDLPQYQLAFEHSVGKKKPLAYFEYNFNDTPLGAPVKMKVMHRGNIVGAHSIRPLLLNIGGDTVKAGLTMDSFVHPGHREQGLFTELVTATTAEAMSRGWHVIFGFANQNSIDIYKRQLVHVEPGSLRYTLLKPTQSSVRSGEYSIHDHRLPESTAEILAQDCGGDRFQVSVQKDRSYLEWRYLQSPESRYQILSHGQDYLCILKEYGEQLQLVDLFYTDSRRVADLLGACLDYAAKQRRPLSFWLSDEHPLRQHCRTLVTRNHPAPQRLHVFSKDSSYSDIIGKLSNWHYVMGDSDVF